MSRNRGRKRKTTHPYIIPSSPKPIETKQVKLSIDTQIQNQLKAIQSFKDLIRSGKNNKGKNLKNEEITKLLTTIAKLEHNLSIKRV